MTTDTTREDWLTEAAHYILDDLLMPLTTKERPPFRVSVGFTGARSSKAIASCFVRAASGDGHNEIFVSPEHNDSLAVLASLVHELIHAIDDCQSGHRGGFAKLARTAGLEGPLTATVAGEWLKNWLQENIVAALGPIPHAPLVLSKARKKQSTRMLKLNCSQCGWHFRASQKNVDAMTSCDCLACGEIATLIRV
jgi:hypothetical protein